jgi:hypothetical protein
MSVAIQADVVTAAMSIAKDVAEGRVDPSALQATAVAECQELFGTVVGDGDALWTLHADGARQAIALGALSADELSEWAAVMRRRAGEPLNPPAPPVDLLSAESFASVDESQPESTDEPDAADPAGGVAGALAVLAALAAAKRAETEAEPPPATQRPADGYDPLAGWDAGGSRRL